MNNCERIKYLLMGLIDDELTDNEKCEVHDHLRKCASCRDEYSEMVETGKILNGVSFNEPDDEILERIWKNPFTRFSRISGFVLLFGGWVALIAYSVYQALIESKEPFFSRISTSAVIIGFIVLLLSVMRERLTTFKSDKYKGVQR